MDLWRPPCITQWYTNGWSFLSGQLWGTILHCFFYCYHKLSCTKVTTTNDFKMFCVLKNIKVHHKKYRKSIRKYKERKKICIVLLGRLFVFWSNKHLFFSMYLSVIKLRVKFFNNDNKNSICKCNNK